MAPEKRRQQITASAVRAFARLGLGHTTHSQVAEQACVSISTVFSYFPTREALVDAVLSEVEQYWFAQVSHAFRAQGTAIERLLAIVKAYADSFDTDLDYVKIHLDWSTTNNEHAWARFVKYQDQILGKFEALIREGQKKKEISRKVDSELGAHLIVGSAHMITQMKMRGRSSKDINDFISAIVHGALLAR
jgi:TetR/AcrR family transcriptional regulator, hemagglutinin/protease regulatory protein